MVTVAQIFQFINGFAPFRSAMDFDNVGLLIGSPETSVHTVIVTMDITPKVVRQALEENAQLIISHHPVIFHPLKRLSPADLPYILVQKGICALAVHTNYDLAKGGVNDCLAQRLQLQNIAMLEEYERSGLALSLMGELQCEMLPGEFAAFVKERLGCKGLKFTVGNSNVKKVALACGAGGGSVFAAGDAGADAFVCGECKHHELLAACDMGLTMVDAGHFATEDVAIEPLCDRLAAAFEQVRFVKSVQVDEVEFLV